MPLRCIKCTLLICSYLQSQRAVSAHFWLRTAVLAYVNLKFTENIRKPLDETSKCLAAGYSDIIGKVSCKHNQYYAKKITKLW